MPAPVLIHLLPTTVTPDRLAGSIAVMIDVLRASTTLTHALAAGCHTIRPCRDVDTARTLADRPSVGTTQAGQPPLLAGERGGTRIDGFDLGNSPARFTPETVGGREIVFTTTNGTAALETCRDADTVLVAGFSNIGAIVTALARRRQTVHLVCAGTDGQISAEDCLCAGAIGEALLQHGFDTQSHDATRIAIELYHSVHGEPTKLLQALRDSHGGRNLIRLGFDDDISLAARRDTVDLVPTFDSHTRTISVLA